MTNFVYLFLRGLMNPIKINAILFLNKKSKIMIENVCKKI